MRKSNLKKRQRQKRKIRWRRVIFLLLLPLAALVGLGVWAYETYYQLPPQKPAVFIDKFKNVPVAKNQTNILLVAVSESGSNTGGGVLKQAEAIIVAGINFDTDACNLLAIPRDTVTTEDKDREKISRTYTSGGVTFLQSRTEDFLQIPVHHYLAMDKETFAQIIDILGGLDLYVEKDLKYQDPYAHLDIDLKRGYQRLNGNGAVGYVSYCADELGEVGRTHRQQKFLEAFFLEKFSPLNIKFDNISKLPQLKAIVQATVETDITPPEALKLANTLRNLRQNSLKTEMLPGHTVVIDNTAYWESDKEEAKKLIAELFYQ